MSIKRLLLVSFAAAFVVGIIYIVKNFAGFLPWLPLALALYFSGGEAPSETAVNRGIYYRVTTQYLVDNIEPLNFDVVVTCETNRPKEVFSKNLIVPSLFLKRTKDNHAVLMSLPYFCTTIKDRYLGQRLGAFDGSFLPLTIWFQDADNLEMGLGYTSNHSYKNTAARLTVLSSSVRYASREEFEDWYSANRNDNLIISKDDSPALKIHPVLREYKDLPFSNRCYGIGFASLNREGQKLLDAFWPRGRPEFWTDANLTNQKRAELNERIEKSSEVKLQAFGNASARIIEYEKKFDWQNASSTWDIVGRNKSKLSNYLSYRFLPTEHYPLFVKDDLLVPESGQGILHRVFDLNYRSDLKGFAACYLGLVDARREGLDNLEVSSQLNVNGKLVINSNDLYAFDNYLIRKDKSIGSAIYFSFSRGFIFEQE
ncbi:hypothetical protein [Roseibium album]|uniref:Uncharacterized protein n=1 Tax=Roseibium album TaxID=311410 RepID=A0A0M7AZV1_9HYPH|nr:hypothetical protein [Roseibium album]CTQ63273.1 hypothetical protein LA5094_06071 [Roseibium album]CTQ69036.1 hypothetical protein LA5096_01987 [Roseibium album]CTQ80785.1 hypothetical protein LA5095_06026 [Roseibium album]